MFNDFFKLILWGDSFGKRERKRERVTQRDQNEKQLKAIQLQ